MKSEESQQENISIKNDPVLEQQKYRITERESDELVVEERSRQYAEQGITTKIAHDIVELIKKEHERGYFIVSKTDDHFYTFYLNASDPLSLLEKHINVEGEHVLTVGSNGDFAKILMEKGAKQVDVFDISLPGVFYNELGMVALQELDFEMYRMCMNGWKDKVLGSSQGMFHEGIYHELRGFLSEQARVYFDTLMTCPELFAEQYFDFGQRREHKLPREMAKSDSDQYVTLVGSLIKDKDAYKKLQQKARETPVSFSWASANAMVKNIAQANGTDDEFVNDVLKSEKLFSPEYTEKFAQINTVYLSNVAYEPEKQIALAKQFLKAGVGRVIMTMRANEYAWFFGERDNTYIDEAGKIHTINPYTRENDAWLKKHVLEVRKLVEYKGKPLFPGDVLEYEGSRLRIIDYNNTVEFGMLVEMRREE